jgi:hypothetical protein
MMLCKPGLHPPTLREVSGYHCSGGEEGSRTGERKREKGKKIKDSINQMHRVR